MPPASRLRFVLIWSVVGLAVAAALLIARPDLLRGAPPVVTIREAPPTAPARAAIPAPASYAGAVARAAPAVVNVYTAKLVTRRRSPLLNDPLFRYFFGERAPAPRRRLQTSLGSGVLVSPQGYILTNNHVIDGAEEIQVQLADGRTAAASVVGTDPETDLAVLHIDLKPLPAITVGDSRHLRVGDVVLAIGNPFGVGQTVTQGIVSATGRHALGLNVYEDFIQTDAAINPGNSGGALVDADGDLVGINTAIFTRSGGSQGIGFAIPERLAVGVLRQIIEHGEVIRGWLGIEVQDLTPALAQSFGLKDTRGFVIAGIVRGGPAQRAGLHAGDVVTAIDGRPVADAQGALRVLANTAPGTRVRVSGLRGGRPFTLTATVARRPRHG